MGKTRDLFKKIKDTKGKSHAMMGSIKDRNCMDLTNAGGCDRHTQRGGRELPHVRGQGQKPGGPHARGEVAKRSYSTPEARGSGQEKQPYIQGVVAAPAQEGLEKLFHVQGQEGQQ